MSAEARTPVADCNVLLLHSKDVSSYIDPQKQFNQNAMNQLTQRNQFKSSRLLCTILQLSDFLEWALCQS